MSAEAITQGNVALGIELGSTRIKACLIDTRDSKVLATGGFEWENQYVDGLWSYSLESVWQGVQAAYAELRAQVKSLFGAELSRPAGIGVSAMMHGYLAFDEAGELLAPFRTWRNTNTGEAAETLSERFGLNIPLRWSIAHYYQALLNKESHVAQVAHLTTLAGYVHWKLTGERVLGIGDASGMFPIDDATRGYDARCLAEFEALAGVDASPLLPSIRVAGEQAGTLTAEGAKLLDPTGTLEAGIPFAAPEGDAGTGMVATAAVAPRTGNVSVGTSVFAMVVLEGALSKAHHEIDLVTTPAGDPVAMVHCNNGASELAAWAGMFSEFAKAIGSDANEAQVFKALFGAAAQGDADAGGMIAYNHLAGEPVAGVDEGRPMVVRTPNSTFTLANFMRAQLFGVFGSLSLGMRVLADEQVAIDRLLAHGGVFKTEGVAQQILADAMNAPVAVADTAAEGGAWGMAVLASYVGDARPLGQFLAEQAFAGTAPQVLEPTASAVAGYERFLGTYEAGLEAERAAAVALRPYEQAS